MTAWNTAKAEQMWLAGTSATAIFPIVGAPSRSAVIAHMNRRGLGRPGTTPDGKPAHNPWTTGDLHGRVADMWREGKSAKVIAAAVGHVVTSRAIVARMHRHGVQAPAKELKQRRERATMAFVHRPEDRKAPSLKLVHEAAQLPDDSSGLKTLIERGPHECCWPVGAPHPIRGQLYCGQPAKADARSRRYCSAHTPDDAVELMPLRWNDKGYRRAEAERHESERDLRELFA